LYDINARVDVARISLAPRGMLAFGLLIVILVIAGALWIMADLNANMMMPPALMNLQMQH